MVIECMATVQHNIPMYYLYTCFLFFLCFSLSLSFCLSLFLFFFLSLSLSLSQVSAAAKETIEFVEAQSPEDPLIKGVPEATNPFKEKGGCIIS